MVYLPLPSIIYVEYIAITSKITQSLGKLENPLLGAVFFANRIEFIYHLIEACRNEVGEYGLNVTPNSFCCNRVYGVF